MTVMQELVATVRLDTANALGGLNQIQKQIGTLKADLFSLSGSLDKTVAGLRKLNQAQGNGGSAGPRAASGGAFGGASPAAVYAQTRAQSEATARAQIAANARIEAERLKNDRAMTQGAAKLATERLRQSQRAGIVEAQTQRAVLQTQREAVRLEQDRSRAKLASISLVQREAQVQQKTLADRMRAIGPIKGPFSGPQQQRNDNPMPLSTMQQIGMAARRLIPGLGGAAGIAMTGRTPLPQANPLWFLQRDAYFNQRRQDMADRQNGPSLLGRVASALNPLNALRGVANVASRLNPLPALNAAVRGMTTVASRLNPMNLLPQRQGSGGGGPSFGLMAGASFIGNMGTQVAMAVGGAIKNQIGDVFSAIAENERLNTSFQTLVGREMLRTGQVATPEEALQKAVPETQRLRREFTLPTAIQSPFGEEDVASVYQRLLTVGFGMDRKQPFNAENVTKGLVDLSSAYRMNGDEMNRLAKALGDVQSRGYLTGEEVRQFVNARFDVQGAVAKVMNVSREKVAELQKEKKISADTVLKAFMDTVNEEPIKGAAKRTAESWGGLAETFQDLGRVVKRELGGPAFEALRPPVIAFSNFLQQQIYSGKLTELGQKIGRGMQAGMDLAQRVISQVQGAGAPALDRLVKSYQQFQALRKQGLNRTGVAMGLKDLGIPEDLATTAGIWADKAEQALKGAWRRVSSAASAWQQSRAGGATVGKAGEAFLRELGMPSDLANVAGKWADGAARAVGGAFQRIRMATVVWDQGGGATDVLQALGLPKGAADMLGGWAEGAARAVGGALGRVKDAVVTAANGGTRFDVMQALGLPKNVSDVLGRWGEGAAQAVSGAWGAIQNAASVASNGGSRVDVMVALGIPQDAAATIDDWGTKTAQAVGTAFGRVFDAVDTAQKGGTQVNVLERLGLTETDAGVVDNWLKGITAYFEQEGRKQDAALQRASLNPIFTGGLTADFDNRTFLQKVDEVVGKVGSIGAAIEGAWSLVKQREKELSSLIPEWLKPFKSSTPERSSGFEGDQPEPPQSNAHPMWAYMSMGPEAHKFDAQKAAELAAASNAVRGGVVPESYDTDRYLGRPAPSVPDLAGAANFQVAREQAQAANAVQGNLDLPSREEIATAIAERVAPTVQTTATTQTAAAATGMQSPDRMDARAATGTPSTPAQVPVSIGLTPEPTVVQEAIGAIAEKLTGAKTVATDTAPVFGDLSDKTKLLGESAATATPSVDALGVSANSTNFLAGRAALEQYGGAVGSIPPLADGAAVSVDAFGNSIASPNFGAGLATLSGYTNVLSVIPGLADSAAAGMQRLNQAADQFETPEGLQRHSPSEMEQSLEGTSRSADRAGRSLGRMPIAAISRAVQSGQAEFEDFGLTLDDVQRTAQKPIEPGGVIPPTRDQYYTEPAFRQAKPGGATQTGPARLLPNAPGTTASSAQATGKAQAQAKAEEKKPAEPLKANYQIEYDKRIQSGFERVGGLQPQIQSGDLGTVMDKYLFRIGVNRDEQVKVGNYVRSAIDSARDSNGLIPNLEDAVKAFGTPEGDSIADEIQKFLEAIGVKQEQLNATVEAIRQAETGMKNDLRKSSVEDTVGKLLDEPRFANEKQPDARRKLIEDLVQSLIDRPTPEDAKGLNLPTLEGAKLRLDQFGRPLPLRPEPSVQPEKPGTPPQVDRYGRPVRTPTTDDYANWQNWEYPPYTRPRTPGLDPVTDFYQGDNGRWSSRPNSRTPGLDAARGETQGGSRTPSLDRYGGTNRTGGAGDYALPPRITGEEGEDQPLTVKCECQGSGANVNIQISVSADADPNSVAKKVAPLIVEQLRLQGIRP